MRHARSQGCGNTGYLGRVVLFVLFCLFATSGIAADSSDLSAEFLDRRAALRRMGDQKYIRFGDYQKSTAYDVLAATAYHGCGPAEWRDYMSRLPELPPAYPGDGPIEMFTLPPLARYLHQFGHCLSSEQKQRILSGLTGGGKKQYLTGHGTLNHAIMRVASWYLLAQYFPDANWTDMDGRVYRSDALQILLKGLLTRRSKHVQQFGHYELLSPTYAIVDLFPLLGLVDFAQDPEVRKLAEAEATVEVVILRAHSFHGVIVPPLTRKNFDQVNALSAPADYVPAVAQHVLWYYFGEPAGLGLYDLRSGKEPFYVSMLALSNWVPPTTLLSMSTAEDRRVRLNTPRFGIWDEATPVELSGDGFVSDDFALGTGNVVFQPGGYSGHIQTFSVLLKSDKPQNQIECYHPFWHSSQGEDAWSTDRSSPFQQMYRYDDSSVVMLFDIPEKDLWPLPASNRFFQDRNQRASNLFKLATCRIPRDFDQVVKLSRWVFVRHGKVFVAMATLNGSNEYDKASEALLKKFSVMKVRESRTALFIRVERERPDLSFAQFQQSMLGSTLPVLDLRTGSVSLIERDGTQTTVRPVVRKLSGEGDWWAALPEVVRNGVVVSRDESFVIDAGAVSLRSGVLRMPPPAANGGTR
ncbi:MAG: hypothetical protein QM776_12980 [Rhodocyclaceae bacterium]